MEDMDLEQAELEPCAEAQDVADESAVSAPDQIGAEDAHGEIEMQ